MYESGIYVDISGRTSVVLKAETRKKFDLKNKDKVKVYDDYEDRIVICLKENRHMRKHFVNFLYPGVICADTSSDEVDGWNKEQALEKWKTFSSKPYGFYFTTFERNDLDWMPKEIARSGTYFINGVVKTLDEVKAEFSPGSNLIWNMETNHWDKIIITASGFTQPFLEDDKNLTV